MRLIHVLFAVLIMAVWGFSFAAIKFGLKDTSPLLLCSLRFFLTTFPAIFFIKKPHTSWTIIGSYGFFMFVMMFSFAFFSLNVGLAPGLASLLIQLQIFFTLLLSVVFLKEHLTPWQILGTVVSFGGLALVGFHTHGEVSLPGLGLILGAALSWGVANVISKKAGQVNMVALIVWGSLFAWPLLLITSIFFDGKDFVLQSLEHLSWLTIGSVLYMAYPATVFGFSMWSWLLSRHKAASVTPFGLLVPFFGMLGAYLFFDESIHPWKLFAALLVIGGLSINLFGGRLAHKFHQFQRPAQSL